MTEQVLNPWFSMWTKPRETIQQIVDRDPEDLIYVLAALGGISNALDRASGNSLGDKYDTTSVVIFSIIGGIVVGAVTILLFTELIKWTGRLFSGKGETKSIRAAIAWANVPLVWSLILWIPALAVFGSEMFTTEMPRVDASDALLMSFFAYGIVELVIAIWALVVLLKCVAQVQGFSAWAALGNVVAAVLVILIPVIALAVMLQPSG